MRRAAALLAAVWLLAAAAAASAAPSQKDQAEGRRHLHKANALAADAKCDAAVREYTFAYQKLHDPVVLYNRAECYRRLGQNAAAAADYRAFLDAVPRAPNRAEVEARLAVLEGGPPPVVSPPPVRPLPPAQAVAPALAPPVTPVTPSPTAAPPPPAPEVTSEPPVVGAVAGAPSPAPPLAGGESHGRLWLWAAIGAAVAGGAVGAYLVARSPGASPPPTELGNYKF